MIELLILAPDTAMLHHAPSGFTFTGEVFKEAKLRDSLSAEQKITADLERAVHYLTRRFPRRIRVQWVDPWSFGGLWCAVRFRVRHYPTVIVNRRTLLFGEQITMPAFTNTIAELLSASPISDPTKP